MTDVFIGSLREGAPVCDGWRSTRVLRILISLRQEKLLPSLLRNATSLKREADRVALSCVGLCFVTDVFIGSLREGDDKLPCF